MRSRASKARERTGTAGDCGYPSPAAGSLLFVVHAVTPRPDQRQCDGGEQEHTLQLECPAASLIAREELGAMYEAESKQHVDADDRGADSRVETGDYQQGRDDFADVHAVGEKRRQSGGGYR